jgi:integrase
MTLHPSTPRTYRDDLPPRAVPWPVVQQLLASFDLTSKSGPRDHCMLHLIAHYGLRPSEVATLRLDSIDWEKKLLRIEQPKTRRTRKVSLHAGADRLRAPATTLPVPAIIRRYSWTPERQRYSRRGLWR